MHGIRQLFGQHEVILEIFLSAKVLARISSDFEVLFPYQKSFGSRAIDGGSQTLVFVTMVSILMAMFPSKTSSVIAWTETFGGIGYLIGPAVGSLLFSVGGFELPFWTVGAAVTILIILSFLLVPTNAISNQGPNHSPRAQTEQPSLCLKPLFKSPLFLLPLVDNFICHCGAGMIDAMIDPFMKNEEGAEVTDVGLMFLIGGLVFMIVTPLFGTVRSTAMQRLDLDFHQFHFVVL